MLEACEIASCATPKEDKVVKLVNAASALQQLRLLDSHGEALLYMTREEIPEHLRPDRFASMRSKQSASALGEDSSPPHPNSSLKLVVRNTFIDGVYEDEDEDDDDAEGKSSCAESCGSSKRSITVPPRRRDMDENAYHFDQPRRR